MREGEITLVKIKSTPKFLGSIVNSRNAALFSIKFAINKYLLIMQFIKKSETVIKLESLC